MQTDKQLVIKTRFPLMFLITRLNYIPKAWWKEEYLSQAFEEVLGHQISIRAMLQEGDCDSNWDTGKSFGDNGILNRKSYEALN